MSEWNWTDSRITGWLSEVRLLLTPDLWITSWQKQGERKLTACDNSWRSNSGVCRHIKTPVGGVVDSSLVLRWFSVGSLLILRWFVEHNFPEIIIIINFIYRCCHDLGFLLSCFLFCFDITALLCHVLFYFLLCCCFASCVVVVSPVSCASFLGLGCWLVIL